ncbi:UDP-2,4-diacetamido-2,4,6-trideoxy-beta-L-altropyranose hydrolase [Aestuariibacter sp. AA17]|uniref:UDP-2,4-diacetamido-2,4, 6-trideoxy-beta-L-altropyranose hydrolase n=1 Tax=Fluctibacter corallii TaxID=2984329 RepID=A0ABT3AA24_9ALTE|nr:UDP-2,4-diacetamido-2,4,6-trideoxy-beta-L-altropyranose hydrolase [Aestuariibacter sp. AA17]MCV2885459.1 UDP-2,4-diacetamido-2,4,6-trideoxy-beta-L-altropyranose hydrolase [Aestuariibacter sp. AA17]
MQLSTTPIHVLFRVDASSQIGLGHLLRCLALAQAFDSASYRVTFIVNEAAYAVCQSREDWVGSRVIIPSEFADSDTQELAWIENFIQIHAVDIAVIDGYHFGECFREVFRQLCKLVVAFDDMNCLHALFCDVVINAAPMAFQLNYDNTAPTATQCLGASYRVMRREFAEIRALPISKRQALTIIMGGSDPKGLTIPLLNAMNAYPIHFPVNVITGAAYPNQSELLRVLEGLSFDVSHYHDLQRVAALFNQSRLVISAAGSSQFELQTCGTPSHLLVVADNQLLATQSAQEEGWARVHDLSVVNDSAMIAQCEKIVESVLCDFNDYEQLTRMHELALRYADNEGATRVVKAIEQKYKELTGKC